MFWVLRLGLSGIFIYAGAAKMRDAQSFAESIASFQILPGQTITPAALTLPPMEILAAAMALADGTLRRAGAFSLFLMLTVFVVALASALARGLHVDCGCLGGDRLDLLSPTKNLWVVLGRDLALGTVAWLLYADARQTPKTKTPATEAVAGVGG